MCENTRKTCENCKHCEYFTGYVYAAYFICHKNNNRPINDCWAVCEQYEEKPEEEPKQIEETEEERRRYQRTPIESRIINLYKLGMQKLFKEYLKKQTFQTKEDVTRIMENLLKDSTYTYFENNVLWSIAEENPLYNDELGVEELGMVLENEFLEEERKEWIEEFVGTFCYLRGLQ